MEIAAACPADAEAIAAIYAHHVVNGTASFDEVPPDATFWSEKIDAILERGWPFLAARQDARVVGYAYATQFRDRPAYRFTCENSIYVHPGHVGQGVGRRLMTELAEAARQAGFREMIAVVGGGEPASIALHRACGFAEVGRMRGVGFKFGRLLDTVYMQLSLATLARERD